MKCFYHRDMDGICAAAIVYWSSHFMQDEITLDYPECIAIDYKDTLNLSIILPNEQIWIVDFSFKPEIMEELLKITQNITWIDHHKTAIDYNYSRILNGIRDIKFSGCELTWQYLHKDKPIPRIVEMLGRYDVWDFSKYGEDLNKLQTGVRLYAHDPECFIWQQWFDVENGLDRLVELLEKGQIALQYRDNQYASLIKAWSFWVEFEGYKAICCNAGSVSSQLFDSVKEDYDLMIPFVFDGKQWTISLYTKKDIDCSKIAEKYGGGGHKQAAGFQCKELPFLLKNSI